MQAHMVTLASATDGLRQILPYSLISRHAEWLQISHISITTALQTQIFDAGTIALRGILTAGIP
jgi:hypothetical protein